MNEGTIAMDELEIRDQRSAQREDHGSREDANKEDSKVVIRKLFDGGVRADHFRELKGCGGRIRRIGESFLLGGLLTQERTSHRT